MRLAMLCKFLPVVVFLLVLLSSIAAKMVARMNTETVLSMLDSSLCGSELDNESGNESGQELAMVRECATNELEDDLEGTTRESNDREMCRGSPSAEQQERSGNASVKGGVSTSIESDEGEAGTDNEEDRSSSEDRDHTDSEDCECPESGGESQGRAFPSETGDDLESSVNINEDGESDGGGDCSDEDATPKSRKRVRRPKKWKKNKRITRRNSGKCYTSVAGKQVTFPVLYMVCTLTHLRFLGLFLPPSSLPPSTPSLPPSLPSLPPSLPSLPALPPSLPLSTLQVKAHKLTTHRVAVLCTVTISCLQM